METKKSEDFTPSPKAKILKRDEYRCVFCGYGEKEGFELYVEYIKPKDLGGRALIYNGQTIHSRHRSIGENFRGLFGRSHKIAKKEKDKLLQTFCADILKVYAKHGINDHIEWKK